MMSNFRVSAAAPRDHRTRISDVLRRPSLQVDTRSWFGCLKVAKKLGRSRGEDGPVRRGEDEMPVTGGRQDKVRCRGPDWPPVIARLPNRRIGSTFHFSPNEGSLQVKSTS